MATKGDSTREQIVIAATRLFYGEGIRAVSMDAVAEKAGVTKKTLYYHFTSKDQLVAETIAARDQPTLDLYMRWFAETDGTVADKIRGLFTRLGKSVDTPKWRGCGFLRTIAELANTPAHPAVKAGAAHKKRFEAWLEAELRDRDIADAAALARRIVILLDGATTVMLIHRDLAYVETAGRMALDLVTQARRAG
ncbi:TetR/AcrR family transcriptional regulator [Bradyrhizobium sp. BR13661]|jgi:AcrR family transcriptional regulator|uniref:TetR/AcrR family transcriptional regulator n=1 Tax=Bradyrhizobium sp. BR13661 TaxID=2940622 RepID=UPI002475F0AA|nr:TetR/AcrR family transcriptional regulator [Bradyrhizobium sp. BR13661]MDH6264389.1 AcrR family transcriptional regulator [Bradyrhizobium sp. BR13661]